MDRKPTIAELEEMLASPDDKYSIEIQPDGSIRAVEGEPHHAEPKILTFEEALSLLRADSSY